MNILHVVSRLDPKSGGPVEALRGLALAQKKLGIDVSVASTFMKGDDFAIADELKHSGVKVHLIGPCYNRSLKWHPHIAGTLENLIQISDVVHIHALWEEIQFQATRIARKIAVPYIIRACGMLDPWSLSQGGLHKKMYLSLRLNKMLNNAAAIHYTALKERQLAEQLHINAPAIVEPNGLTLSDYDVSAQSNDFVDTYSQLKEGNYLLFLSRIHKKKGLDILIPAFSQMEEKNLFLVIAGPDSVGYLEEIRSLARNEGVEKRIIFSGPLSGRIKIDAFRGAKLFVLPSYQENFGIVVIEALACGTPVIVSDQVNICDEIAAAGVGGVCKTTVDDLFNILSEWLESPSQISNAESKAKEFVAKNYDWNSIAEHWQKHYEKLARDKGKVAI